MVLPDGPTARGAGTSCLVYRVSWWSAVGLAMLGAGRDSVVAAEAVDEAAVAFAGTFGGCGGIPRHGAEEFALFGGFAAGLFAVFGFAIEGLGDGGGAALLA